MEREKRLFILLNRLFWVLWVVLPLVIGWALHYSYDKGIIGREGNNCSVHYISKFSVQGQTLIYTYVALQIIPYILGMGLIHRLISQFAKGEVYVDRTLRSINWIALIIFMVPFLDTIFSNILSYALYHYGDMPSMDLSYFIDVGTLAIALALWSLRLVVSHAIGMNKEMDYTI